MNKAEQILELLSRKPLLKARQIADELGIDREVVNSTLYDHLNTKVVQDNQYRWQLRKSTGQADPTANYATTKATPLARLSRYYLGCLTHDINMEITAHASKESGNLNYVELDEFPLLEDSDTKTFDAETIQTLRKKGNQDRNRTTIFLGYPVRINWVHSQKVYMVDPVMLFPSREGFSDNQQTISFEDIPILNFTHLRNFATTGSRQLIYEAILLADELGLTNATEELPDLDELFYRLPVKRPDWDWKENPDVHRLSSNPLISEITEQGIYNRAILISGERSVYTQGLESELAKLERLSKKEYSGTALGYWLSSDTVTRQKAHDPIPLIQAVPLNSEQRDAIQRSFSNPLTVITGPPGTGKSQVVTALLMNAAWRGKRVLFASKNNKAVDVVEHRVNALGPRPILLRLGTDEYQIKLADYLSSLLAAKATADDKSTYQYHLDSHAQFLKRMETEQLKLEKLVSARNQVDRIEQDIENLRTIFGEENIRKIKNLPTEEIDKAISDFSVAFKGVDPRHRSTFQKLLWPLKKETVYAGLKDAIQKFQNVGNILGMDSPSQLPSDNSIFQWIEFRNQVLQRRVLVDRINKYFKSLASLQTCIPAEEVTSSMRELISAIADNSMQLWQYWLRIQPDGLSLEQRKLLGEYSALLKLIAGANEENRSLNRNLLRRYYNIFTEIAQMLPCWAVTSLSARRLPFEPGFFDLVIIDEASQCDIASALPLLYRAEHAVVIGDPKQLRHITSINIHRDQQLLAAQGLEADYTSWAYSVHSLFDLASSLCRSEDIIVLRDHHRSHADIISFSNNQFYEGRLRVATRYNSLNMVSEDFPAIQWIDLSGRVSRPSSGGAVNEKEAQAVVRKVRNLLLKRGYKGTIGVVSPFRAHANRIREIISKDKDLEQKLVSSEFLADTIHRFQGDERDLIIFSPVISDGITDTAINFLRNNGNLFNVAITRARSILIVIGDKKASAHSDIDYLEHFSKYVDDLAETTSRKESKKIVDFGPEYPNVSRPERVSDWERKFYKYLFLAGHRPIPQYTVDQYDLDFALFGGNDHKLNIEIDGERYHRDWDGELCRRDQIRNQRLMELGWDVMRFWVYEIRDDLDNCISRVNDWVEKSQQVSLNL